MDLRVDTIPGMFVPEIVATQEAIMTETTSTSTTEAAPVGTPSPTTVPTLSTLVATFKADVSKLNSDISASQSALSADIMALEKAVTAIQSKLASLLAS